MTHIIPVIEGCSFPHLTRRLNVAGRDVTARLVDLLQRRGYGLNRSADFDTARALKERLCYVSADCKRELQVSATTACPSTLRAWEHSCAADIAWGIGMVHLWTPSTQLIMKGQLPKVCKGCLLRASARHFPSPYFKFVMHASVRARYALQLARETTCQQQSYTLPDGRTIRLASERFMAPEALFNPSLLDMEAPGIAEQVFQCIQVHRVLPTAPNMPQSICCSVAVCGILAQGSVSCTALIACPRSKDLRISLHRTWMWTIGCLFISTSY